MKHLMCRLWQDDDGAIIAAEYLFVVTILVIGTIVGLSNVRDALVTEMVELGNALLALSGATPCDPPTHTAPAAPSFIDVAPCG
jgi:Flp pilus assembly pilin Flp